MGSRLISKVCQARKAAVFTAGLVLISFAAAQTTPISISETGSTLIFPLFQTWVAAYSKVDPNLHMTVGATGSGAGIAQAIANRVQIGTSDAYMSDDQKMAHPDILNIPLAISAQVVEANLPELHGAALKLSGPVLAGIYTGKIHSWDAAPIAALNPGVHLPHHAIVPVHRADGSGDTLHLHSVPQLHDLRIGRHGRPILPRHLGSHYRLRYRRALAVCVGAISATGNQGMVQTLSRTPYSVGYLGGSFQDQANKAGLITAMLKNQSGKFLLPTQNTVTAAAASLTPRTPPDERLTLVFAPGDDSYPLINYEYAVVSQKQAVPGNRASAISNFCCGVSPRKVAARRACLTRFTLFHCRLRYARAAKYRLPKFSNDPSCRSGLAR